MRTKPRGEHMQQEAAQELWRCDGHHSFVIAVGIISPAESDLVVGEGDQAMVGDGDAMSVAGEIAEDMMGTAEGWFGIDDQVLREQRAQESAVAPKPGPKIKDSESTAILPST